MSASLVVARCPIGGFGRNQANEGIGHQETTDHHRVSGAPNTQSNGREDRRSVPIGVITPWRTLTRGFDTIWLGDSIEDPPITMADGSQGQ